MAKEKDSTTQERREFVEKAMKKIIKREMCSIVLLDTKS